MKKVLIIDGENRVALQGNDLSIKEGYIAEHGKEEAEGIEVVIAKFSPDALVVSLDYVADKETKEDHPHFHSDHNDYIPVVEEFCKAYEGGMPQFDITVTALVSGIDLNGYLRKMHKVGRFLGISLIVESTVSIDGDGFKNKPINELYYSQEETDLILSRNMTIGAPVKNRIIVFVGESESDQNGFAVTTQNAIFVKIGSHEESSNTLVHEFGHMFGLGHTFEMLPNEKKLLGITPQNVGDNFMNYTPCRTVTITTQQKNLVCHNANQRLNPDDEI